ncbi:hypothetical protein PRECH8_13160 [Insulibacter thermoxylanivorax]|uniref:Uncharacterized protein n=1 Tax=Insulibacter thermoxylanivorax TaxID=2749268 RepID=A0A916QC40_9BACL|nr:hypothetical protein [Insulibacter thermoxylanivorax]GFR38020.1 hypothetical protein PRECH8_13160 [Insulibacter thermoxylanivorax]
MQIPSHLPRKLTITMWDISWYTMTMPGEPYHDLGAAFAEAVQRMPPRIIRSGRMWNGSASGISIFCKVKELKYDGLICKQRR